MKEMLKTHYGLSDVRYLSNTSATADPYPFCYTSLCKSLSYHKYFGDSRSRRQAVLAMLHYLFPRNAHSSVPQILDDLLSSLDSNDYRSESTMYRGLATVSCSFFCTSWKSVSRGKYPVMCMLTLFHLEEHSIPQRTVIPEHSNESIFITPRTVS